MKHHLTTNMVCCISSIFQPERFGPGYQKGKYFETWSRWCYFKVGKSYSNVLNYMRQNECMKWEVTCDVNMLVASVSLATRNKF